MEDPIYCECHGTALGTKKGKMHLRQRIEGEDHYSLTEVSDGERFTLACCGTKFSVSIAADGEISFQRQGQ